MSFEKLKLELYDFLCVILPGLLAICEGWIFLRGWQAFVAGIRSLNGIEFTLLTVVAFGFGNLTQELGDVAIKTLKGKRYFREARDRFWARAESQLVRDAIKIECGQDISAVDTAFDYCLTRVTVRFAKRDVFVAISDLCRSLVMLSALAIFPAARIAFYDIRLVHKSAAAFAIFLLLLTISALLAWRRMARFRGLSEITVFHTFLAIASEPSAGGAPLTR